MSSKLPILIILLLVGFCCCVGVVCALSGGLAVLGIALPGSPAVDPAPQITVEVITPVLRPTATPAPTTTGIPTAALAPTTESSSGTQAEPALAPEPVTPAGESLQTLRDTIVPINDPRDLAMRLKGVHNIPETLDPPAVFPKVGDKKQFNVMNLATNQPFEASATLRYVGDNVYFWIQDGVSYRNSELERLARTFDQEIYPTTRSFFGSEWNPGIDQDPRLYILYVSGVGGSIAGYFSSNDSNHPLAHSASNGHEMFILSADTVSLGSEFAYSVLAHEFQHMIHWYQDRNEAGWLNEGFSELSAFLNSYSGGGFDYLYVSDPDLQLNDWPNMPGTTGPHYGASFLFVTYLLDRFGDEVVQAVVSHPENGLDSIDIVLAELDIRDPLTGLPVTADDVFADWAAANYLREARVGDGRYTYNNYPYGPTTGPTEEIDRCPQDWQARDVRQYGVDYIRIDCPGSFTINFEGESEASIVPTGPYSGDYAFWSNKGDESNMTLTQAFDFSTVSGPLTLNYWTWYDLEADYDYVYLTASVDGEAWQILKAPRSTDLNPSGNSYGWAYNGESLTWVQESVDISAYAGQKVQLRFEYVTDAAVNGEGFLLDDVSIPEIDYFTDFEADSGGWEADGYVRIQNRLPQTYRISLIEFGQATAVQTIQVSGQEPVELNLTGEVVLVVSGTTRFTRQPAEYRFSISQ